MAHITRCFVCDRGVHLGELFYNGQDFEHTDGDPWLVSLKFILESRDPRMIDVVRQHFQTHFSERSYQFLKNTDDYLTVVFVLTRTLPVQKPGDFTRTQARNLAQKLLRARWTERVC